ncbi:hypothetical protein QE152_g8867 [Popillia japonica]|uniref:Uncharacterized protein n=1 Tax=Popillia japonica TaxID=7064 RepID=A0AAW1LYX8_POPJA
MRGKTENEVKGILKYGVPKMVQSAIRIVSPNYLKANTSVERSVITGPSKKQKGLQVVKMFLYRIQITVLAGATRNNHKKKLFFSFSRSHPECIIDVCSADINGKLMRTQLKGLKAHGVVVAAHAKSGEDVTVL